MIFYKRIIREFLRYFRKRYLRIKRFEDNFAIEKDFRILIKEGLGLELELKALKVSITNSNHYALQLYHNAIQTKL